MLSKFFIHRPNFAIVIAIVITLAGLVALTAIPVAQYPNVTPPQVTISVSYPGASAQTIMNTIAEPIEEQVNGAPNELYMQSSSSSSGVYNLTVTFAIGTDPYIDQVNVQNRVQIAEAQLPTEVQSEGITVRAASSTFVLAVSLFSPTNKYSQLYVSNYEYQHLYQVDFAPARGRQHADFRRTRICHARVDEPRADDRARHHPGHGDRGDPGTESPGFGRPDRRGPDQQQPGAAADGAGAG